ESQVGVVVVAVPVGRTARRQESLLLVVPQRAGALARVRGELTNAHGATVNVDAAVKASPGYVWPHVLDPGIAARQRPASGRLPGAARRRRGRALAGTGRDDQPGARVRLPRGRTV